MRKATVAGLFYEGLKEALEQQLAQCFREAEKKLQPSSKKKDDIIGVIVPHAGLLYSGSIAAYSYKTLENAGFADAFIILGPNHQGIGSGVALYPEGTWETPLGTIPIDEQLVESLANEVIQIDEHAHQFQENSIEVQLPFLQYFNKPFFIAPIVMAQQDYHTATQVGLQLAKTIKNDPRTIRIIASTDFSHEGFAYGRMHSQDLSANEYTKQQDKHAIDAIISNDPKALMNAIKEYNISMCGYGPVMALLTAAHQLGGDKVSLLTYGTSCDVVPDSSACVGYGAFSVTKS